MTGGRVAPGSSERASSPTRVGLARPSTSLAPRIVILGGGFAGVNTALELAKRSAGVLPIRVTLLSERNFFLFTPMLAEAATGAVESRHVLYAIRPLCGPWGIEFGEMSVEAIDLERRRLIARHSRSLVRQQVHYDKLVLALGATPDVAVTPGAAEHALTFKGVGDAVKIRNRVIDLFEAAALSDDPWARQRLLTFVGGSFWDCRRSSDPLEGTLLPATPTAFARRPDRPSRKRGSGCRPDKRRRSRSRPAC